MVPDIFRFCEIYSLQPLATSTATSDQYPPPSSPATSLKITHSSFCETYEVPSAHPPIHPPTRRSVYQSIHPSSYPPTSYPPTQRSFHPAIYPSTHPSVHPPIDTSIHPSVHPSIYPSIYPSVLPSIHSCICPYQAVCEELGWVGFLAVCLLLRGTIVNRTYGIHKNLLRICFDHFY